MAITVEVAAAKFNAAYRNIPINWEVSSDQFGSQFYSATSVANASGKCKYTIGAHVIKVNGVVTGSGFGESTYNVRQTVTATEATKITTDVDFVATDTGTITRTNDNFQIRAEIRKESGSVKIGEKVAQRIDVGGNDRFRFNPANLLTSELSHDLDAVGGTNLSTTHANSLTGYSLKFIEEFDDKAGLRQQFANVIGATKNVINSTRQYLDTDQTMDKYIANTTPDLTNKFLTNAPVDQKIGLLEDAYLSFIFDLSGKDAQVVINRFFANGSPFDLFVLTQVSAVDFRMTIPINDTLFDVATFPQIGFINVWIQSVIGGTHQVTEQRKYTIDRTNYANPVRFHWLNKLGGFDSFTFTGHREETVRTKQIPFSKSHGLSFNIKDRGLTTLGVKPQFLREVISDFLNEADRIWLTEIFTSPEIYVQEGTSLIPIVRTTTQMQFIKDGSLTQLRIRYEMPKHIIQTN